MTEKTKFKLLRELKYLYIGFAMFIALFLVFIGDHLIGSILLIALGIFIVILEALEKDLKLLRLKGKGIEVAIEMSEAKKQLRDKAEIITERIEKESTKAIDKEKVQDIIQKNLDEVFLWGLRVAGYNKPYNEIKDVKIIKDKDGNEGVSWSEN